MSTASQPFDRRAEFDRLLGELRPKLHRYCARMTGSVIDGEDVVQEAIVKALEAFGAVEKPEAWLFRIAHNAALDHLRRRARQEALRSDEDPDMIDPVTPEDRLAAAASLHTFMRLPVAQRSSIILMDVLGYSLDEIGTVTDMSVPAIKASLNRGRTRLRELAAEPDERPAPRLSEGERKLLTDYVDRFNAHDFDSVRAMLADEVKLELVNRSRLSGKDVGRYFGNYATRPEWRFSPGLVDGRAAVLVRRAGEEAVAYFILLAWTQDRVATIRDFHYARYATDGAEIVAVG